MMTHGISLLGCECQDAILFLDSYKIMDDQQQILVSLSYMHGGHADEFVQEELRHNWDDLLGHPHLHLQVIHFSYIRPTSAR